MNAIKSQIQNPKSQTNSNSQNLKSKTFDLEERTFLFAQKIRQFSKSLPATIANREDIKQLLRSSGSIGANYIEANESLGKKDFLMKIKISLKETKESSYWLRLLDCNHDKEVLKSQQFLIKETHELANIFGAILRNSK